MNACSVVSLRAGRRRDDAPWVDTDRPPLSWRTSTETPGWLQASATVRIDWLAPPGPDEARATDVVELTGPDSVGVAWPFRPLRSGERVRLTVGVTGEDGVAAEPATIEVEAPLLRTQDWTAQWVTLPAGTAEDHPGQLRHRFTTAGRPVRARLHVTALGVYECEINGRRVGDEVLAPGWTSYDDRILVQTHDVTELVGAGDNVIGAWVGGGWFTERYGFFGQEERAYSGPIALLAQLELTYADGTREIVTTDGAWRCRTDGPLLSAGIYVGEEFDATRHDPGWSASGNGSEAGWQPVSVIDRPFDTLRPAGSEPVRRVEHLASVGVSTSPSGKTLVDFGQNLVGRVRIAVSGPRGHTITLRHAEVLENGELATRQLGRAVSTDRYTLAGDDREEWEPRFTFHGFRYLQVEDWPGEFDSSSVTAVVCSSAMERTGYFTSSEPLLDRLHENVVWSMRGNFLSIPTDCPQRDERRGWTGDLQVFAGTATTLYDCDAFLVSWLRDVALEQQRAGGIVPITVPTARAMESEAALAAWGDAATVVPWTMYERFGDIDVLRRQLPSMRAWVEAELDRADPDGLWTRGYQLGDWLDPRAPGDRPREGRTHPSLVASAYLFRSLDILSMATAVLGDAAASSHYGALAERTRVAFVETYVTPRGRMVSEGPTTYAMALAFGIVRDEELRTALGRRLADIVREDGYRIGTGFVGTPLIMDALCDTGQQAAAARLLLQTEMPSWLYPVTVGATTIWERWDAAAPDGSINPNRMLSFNHYAFGAVADWLHRELAGLAPAAPGYRRIRVRPTILDGIRSASSEQLTPYGPTRVAWTLVDGWLTIDAIIPPNTTAAVELPDGSRVEVGAGSHSWTVPWVPEPRAFPPYDLDADLADLVDDPEAYRVVREVLERVNPDRAAPFADGRLRYERGSTVRNALLFAPPPTLDAVAQALADLAARR